jgi:hypothetical protein
VVSLAENGKISGALDAQGLETLLVHLLGGGTGDRSEEAGRTGVVVAGQSDA